MKFHLDEEVTVKATGRKGKVEQTKHELFYKNGVMTELNQYYVDFGNYYKTWFKEEEIIGAFSDEFEMGFTKLLIDVHLLERNFDRVKQLQQELLSKGKGLS